MPSRINLIDARMQSVMRALVGTRLPIGVALQHSPGKGSGGSS